MRFIKCGLWFMAASLVAADLASAQTTTGTISGRVVDQQQLPVPGVTVNAESHPALYKAFNPFTTTPVQGVNWDFGPNLGKP